MRAVGIRRGGAGTEVARLSDDGADVTVVASLEEFWADAPGQLSRPAGGPTLPFSTVDLVPPVLPGARVICIGLNSSGAGYARTPPWLLQPGDVVEVERLGVLRNAVVGNDQRLAAAASARTAQ